MVLLFSSFWDEVYLNKLPVIDINIIPIFVSMASFIICKLGYIRVLFKRWYQICLTQKYLYIIINVIPF